MEDVVEAVIETSTEADATKNNISTFYSFQDLKSGVAGIEYAQREQYLSPDEFVEVFGMSKEEFNGLRKWRQHAVKKKVGLF